MNTIVCISNKYNETSSNNKDVIDGFHLIVEALKWLYFCLDITHELTTSCQLSHNNFTVSLYFLSQDTHLKNLNTSSIANCISIFILSLETRYVTYRVREEIPNARIENIMVII